MSLHNPLSARVDAIFSDLGPLANVLSGYRARSGQQRMARAVAATLEHGGRLVVEAGTGIGKTFAYLVPVLLSGRRTIISTAGKALQDQLYGRDIPQLVGALGLPARLALLKGRSSYLCHYHLGRARQSGLASDPAHGAQLASIEVWAHATRSGDLAEIPGLDDGSPWIPLLTSTRENCLGGGCQFAAQCFVNQARRQALAADVVVVNHHLFFADLAIRESGIAELLPSTECVVFDEAHQLNEIGVQFMGTQLGASQIMGLARDVRQRAQQLAGGYAAWDALAGGLETQVQAFGDRFLSSDAEQRFEWQVVGAGGQRQLHSLLDGLQAVGQALHGVASMEPELQLLAARADSLAERLDGFVAETPVNAVRWLSLGRQWRLLQSPLDISGVMQERVTPQVAQDAGKAWIFTSATLGHDARMQWFVDSCGLEGAERLQVESPFDYARQAALYVPRPFPAPSDPAHSAAVAAVVLPAAVQLGGRTLVLTTTLRAMRSIGAYLREGMALQGGNAQAPDILVQGESPKRALLDRFAAGQAGAVKRGAVLVASLGFWEGIDLPGAVLQLLVIDKLPFAPPDDPVQQARVQRLEAIGKNAFNSLQLPQAAVVLKQGAGRLIRRESDEGILVICDVRLHQKSYGARLMSALPPMARLASAAALQDRLDALTRASTTPV